MNENFFYLGDLGGADADEPSIADGTLYLGDLNDGR